MPFFPIISTLGIDDERVFVRLIEGDEIDPIEYFAAYQNIRTIAST